MSVGQPKWILTSVLGLLLCGCPEVTPPPDEPDSTDLGDDEIPRDEPEQDVPDGDNIDDVSEPVEPDEDDSEPIDEPESDK